MMRIKRIAVSIACMIMLFTVGCGSKDKKTEITESKESTMDASTTTMLEESPEWVTKLPEASETDQIMTVAAVDNSTTAWIALHEKDEDGKWQTIMTTPGFIGDNGIGKTKEGDCKTPKGTFHFDMAFGIADDPGCAIPYTKVDEDAYWSGDPRDGMHYNELVSIKDLPDLDTEASEHIIEYTRQYQYCLNMDYNKECNPEKGSAICFHCFGPKCPSTAGCVSLPEDQMRVVMQNVKPDCAVVIDTVDNFGAKLW